MAPAVTDLQNKCFVALSIVVALLTETGVSDSPASVASASSVASDCRASVMRGPVIALTEEAKKRTRPHRAWETNEKNWETNEKKWETNERKWETSQPGT